MEQIIKVKCPAKINLDLMVCDIDKKTGYHNIKTIMQAINLFDYITIKLKEGADIVLGGTDVEIPYNEDNLCYKAARIFLEKIQKNYSTDIFIEKNIPVAAGLAGGSTDAAGVLYGLNKLHNNILNDDELNELASKLGSDLNFCLKGGTKLCTGRGERIIDMPFFEFDLSLVKPKNLKILAREAYSAYDELKKESTMRNDLEFALIDKYEELQFLNSKGMQMTGSGPTYFIRKKEIDFEIDENKYLVINNLKSVPYGVKEA